MKIKAVLPSNQQKISIIRHSDYVQKIVILDHLKLFPLIVLGQVHRLPLGHSILASISFRFHFFWLNIRAFGQMIKYLENRSERKIVVQISLVIDGFLSRLNIGYPTIHL